MAAARISANSCRPTHKVKANTVNKRGIIGQLPEQKCYTFRYTLLR